MRTTCLLLLLFQLSACAISNKTNFAHSAAPGIEDLNVPENFNYANITDVKVDLQFQGRSFDDGPPVKYKILGVDEQNRKDLLAEGLIDEKGKVETGMFIPLHFKDLVLQVDYRSRTYELSLKKRPKISQIIWMDYEGLF
ncbi:MAG: hypothetical protein R2828_07175 [Saprospiraceae bacterium]